jgi:hypothetical protein
MVSAATVLRWSQKTCRLMLFVSDSCLLSETTVSMALEIEAVVRWQQKQKWWHVATTETEAAAVET